MKGQNALGGHFKTKVFAEADNLPAPVAYLSARVGDPAKYHARPGARHLGGAFDKLAVGP